MTETSTVDHAAEPARTVPPSALGAIAGAPAWLRCALLAVGLAVALWLPNGLYPAVAVDILCWALFAVAVDLLLGFTGLMSFGHAAFWGTSAYVTGLVAIQLGVPFPVAVLAGALAAAVLAVPIGYLAVKRTGIYFAMVTLAFAQMIYFIANEWRAVTGARTGCRACRASCSGSTSPTTTTSTTRRCRSSLAGLFAGLADRALAVRPGAGRHPRQPGPGPGAGLPGAPVQADWRSCCRRSSPASAAACSRSAHRFVSLDVLHWTTSGKAVIIVVLGGIGTLWGGLVGAAILVRLEDWLSFSGFESVGLVTGGIFVLVVLLFRRGLWGSVAALLERWWGARRR